MEKKITIEFTEEELESFKGLLVNVNNVCVEDCCGSAEHPCEYYSPEDVVELATKLGVYDADEEDEYGDPLWLVED